MVETFSKKCEKNSTILFFCKKMGKTFDCFLKNRNVRIKTSRRTGKKRNNKQNTNKK